MKTSVQQTSIDSYHSLCGSGQCAQQRNRVLSFIKGRGGDWSIGELAQALSLQKSTVSARINELINQTGELEERPKRKDRVSHITVRPVALPVIQLALFQ